MRRADVAADFNAQRVEVGGVFLQDLSTKLTIERGVLVAAPLRAELLAGKLTAQLRFDARPETPSVSLDLRIIDMQLGSCITKTRVNLPLKDRCVPGSRSRGREVQCTRSPPLPMGRSLRCFLTELSEPRWPNSPASICAGLA